jgi:hypothetical protein
MAAEAARGVIAFYDKKSNKIVTSLEHANTKAGRVELGARLAHEAAHKSGADEMQAWQAESQYVNRQGFELDLSGSRPVYRQSDNPRPTSVLEIKKYLEQVYETDNNLSNLSLAAKKDSQSTQHVQRLIDKLDKEGHTEEAVGFIDLQSAISEIIDNRKTLAEFKRDKHNDREIRILEEQLREIESATEILLKKFENQPLLLKAATERILFVKNKDGRQAAASEATKMANWSAKWNSSDPTSFLEALKLDDVSILDQNLAHKKLAQAELEEIKTRKQSDPAYAQALRLSAERKINGLTGKDQVRILSDPKEQAIAGTQALERMTDFIPDISNRLKQELRSPQAEVSHTVEKRGYCHSIFKVDLGQIAGIDARLTIRWHTALDQDLIDSPSGRVEIEYNGDTYELALGNQPTNNVNNENILPTPSPGTCWVKHLKKNPLINSKKYDKNATVNEQLAKAVHIPFIPEKMITLYLESLVKRLDLRFLTILNNLE